MCLTCEYEDFVEHIDELIEDGECDFALDTLESIREWVVENDHCTEAQRRAVRNIENAGNG